MKLGSILLATDGSEGANKALEVAVDLATAKGARLLVLHVQEKPQSARRVAGLEEWARVEHAQPEELLEDLATAVARTTADEVRRLGVEPADTLVREGDPTHTIVETARELEVDAIVMGSRGLGDLAGLLVGSVSHKVAHLAPCTCIIVR